MYNMYTLYIFFFFWLRKLPEYYFLAQAFANLHRKRRQGVIVVIVPDDAFRAGLRKLGQKNYKLFECSF